MSDNAENQARAQVRSIVEMVAALSVDYDRLQELRDKAAAGHYVAGWNMPGYMPDSEPCALDTCDEARDYIADEMEQDADEMEQNRDDEGQNADQVRDLRELAQTLRDAIGNPDQEFGATVGTFHYWIAHEPGKLADDEEQKELDELNESAGDCTSEDDARERIEQDALSVEVRSGWHSLGESMEPAEFRIVLCTGGPHVEIVGELGQHNEPDAARILYQDWFEGKTELVDITSDERDSLLTYCRTFYFGY